jgi:cysteine desulfurase/selenocysteine lyase
LFDVEAVRGDFPILKRVVNGKPLIYFDNSATTQKPRQVIQAIVEYYEEHNANVARGVHTLSQEASLMYEHAHEAVARFIGAEGMEEIAFVKNATEALNLVAYGWALPRLEEGDEILLSRVEHHSNIVPWQMISKLTGARLSYCDIGEDWRITPETVSEAMDERTKIVSLVQASNVLGLINPIKEIGEVVKEKEALFVVDGAQSVPHIPIDVKELNVDFLAFSAHKMLGPTGIGALYGRGELMEEMNPFLGGGGMIRDVELYKFESATAHWKFEGGTPNIAGAMGFEVAVKYLTKLGMENVWRHEAKLSDQMLRGMEAFDEVLILGPRNSQYKTGLVSFNVKGLNPHDVAALFDIEGIALRSGHHCTIPLHRSLNITGSVRASFYIYNTKEEVDRFLGVLENILAATK